MRYEEYLQSLDWKEKRYLKRRKRNNCAVCNSKKELHVHHLNYKNLYDVEQYDLRVLCKRCHFLAHDLMKRGIIIFPNKNHHSRFSLLKHHVKKELGLMNKNLFT